MNAVILSIGDELVLGQTVDTNSAFLSEELASRGIHTVYHQTVGDDQSMIADSFRTASQAASIVIATGGLGPTEDDLSRQALADALDAELVEHPESADTLRAFFDKRGRRMTANNLVQAQHPLGTEMIPNSCGTAPGIRAELNGATVYVTPGVPFEMHAMFEQSIAPELPSSASDDNAQTAHRFILTEKSTPSARAKAPSP